MNRHAYCIIAHNDVYTLNKLIESIDDKQNDIFLFIDKKSEMDLNQLMQPSESQIITPPQSLNIYWGDISLVKAELIVFRAAWDYGDYSYFHLISGQDLPLKNQGQIHNFFDTVKPGTNFIGYCQGEISERILRSRTAYYVPFTKYQRGYNKLVLHSYSILRKMALVVQKMCKMRRNFGSMKFKKGCQWASLTDEFVKYLLDNERAILETYRGVPCCDEIYKQTIAWNSKFRETLFNVEDEYEGCLREIDWNRGTPYTYRIADLEMLKSSTKLFARKFDSSTDKSIVDAVCALTHNTSPRK